MLTRSFIFLFLALRLTAQPVTVQAADPINLRNIVVSNDGSQLFYAASLNQAAQREGVANIYSTFLSPNPLTTKLTDFQGDDSYRGVMALDVSVAGRIVFTLLADFIHQFEEIRLVEGEGSRLIGTDKEGCPRIQCVSCYTACIRNIHISPNGGTVLYAASRSQPFTAIAVDANNSTSTKLPIYEGSLAASGQRVITNAGKAVFTSAAPFGPTFAAQATDVYTMNLDGTAAQQVTHLTSESAASEAVISANGTWIAFTLNDGGRLGKALSQVWAVRSDGTSLHRISDGTSDATSPSLSADGAVITFLQGGQVKQTVTAMDILALQRVADVTKFAVSTAQSPIVSGDGNRVAFLLGASGSLPASIYTAPVNGGPSRFEQLTAVYAPRFLFSNGLVSAGGTAPPSVGSLMTAYGANLSPEEFSVAASLPLPTKLGGVELLANLEPMALHAVTPWQINAQLAGSRFPETVSFRVRDSKATSPDARVLIRSTAPEAIPMAAVSTAGFLLAAAVFPGTKTLADAEHPAAANAVLEVYSFGLGATDPPVDVGAASPSPAARARVAPRVQIGGRDATVSFAGLVPGLAGVYQVNIQVPSGLAPGYQPLRWIAADGSSSGTSGIYVR